jgi:cytochrome c oxidase assembly factor CtaG
VTGWAADERPPAPSHHQSSPRIERRSTEVRPALAILAVLILVGALVPPLSTVARRVEVLEALQFALLAIVVPALVVLGAPWRLVGLAARNAGGTDSEGVAVLEQPGVADRAAAARRRHPELARGMAYLGLDVALVVAWRIPASVDALARHGWLSLLEAVSLVTPGVGLWLELVESPPFAPRLARPKRIALAAVAMWTIWVTAYLVGLSHASVYRSYAHVVGRDLSVSADQALTTGILWLTSLCAFVPVIFANLVAWLRSDEDPDDALYRLVRDRRRVATERSVGEHPDGGRPFG